MIIVSEQESKITGIKIGRAHLSEIDSDGLSKAIQKFELDVAKLTLKSTASDMYSRLDSLGFPYYILGMVIEYKAVFNFDQPKPYINKDLSFNEYLGEDPEGFKQLVRGVFKFSPSSYYINPGIKDIISEEIQLDCLVAYVETFNRSRNPNAFIHILKIRNETVGFICSYKEGNGGAATYAGVLPQYQGKGLYLDMVHFIQNFGKSIGQHWGKAYVQLQNTVVQKSFLKGGLIPSGYELNVHINSFLGALKR